mgnify:FL=1
MNITEIYVEDETGTIKAVWFNQPYLANSLLEGSWVSLSGKVYPVKSDKVGAKQFNRVNVNKSPTFSHQSKKIDTTSQAISKTFININNLCHMDIKS